MIERPRLVELDQPIEVGKHYMVPCIKIDEIESARGKYKSLNCMAWVPVWPIDHDDRDIGFPEQHYHVDWRFVSNKDIRCIVKALYGLKCPDGPIEDMLQEIILLVIVIKDVIEGPEEWPQCCYRTRLTWPYHHRAPEKLEIKLKGAKLKCNRCPHWGFDLSTVPPDENGIIQCPGHGLCFRADTGDIVPRKSVKETT